MLRKIPSPNPAMHLATMNIPSETAAASSAVPTANIRDPIAIERVRPMLSDIAPAKRDVKVAGKRSEDITKPWSDAESSPKLWMKEGIVVTGPMVPESSLELYQHRHVTASQLLEKRSLPIEHAT